MELEQNVFEQPKSCIVTELKQFWMQHIDTQICVNFQIVPNYILGIRQNFISKSEYLSIEGILYHENGQVVEINPMYRKLFFSKLTSDNKVKIGKFSYGWDLQIVQFTAKIGMTKNQYDSLYSNSIYKPLLDQLDSITQKLSKSLQSVGLLNTKSKYKVNLDVEVRKKVKEIRKILKQQNLTVIQNKKYERMEEDNQSPLVQIEFVNNQEKGQQQQTEDQSNNLPLHKGGYFQIYKKRVTFKKKNSQKQQTIDVAIKKMKFDKKNRSEEEIAKIEAQNEDKIANEKKILSQFSKTEFLINYYKITNQPNCIMMDYIEFTLKDYIYRLPYNGIAQLLQIASQVIKSAIYLHKHNVVHRDFKPSNFLVQLHPKIKLKIIDFCESTLTTQVYQHERTTILACTLPYSPLQCATLNSTSEGIQRPEGFNWQEIDFWSVGIILHELFFKKIPVTYSRCFSQDIKKSWKNQFAMPLHINKKPGIRIIENIINLVCFRMIKIKQKDRLPLQKALALIEIARQLSRKFEKL